MRRASGTLGLEGAMGACGRLKCSREDPYRMRRPKAPRTGRRTTPSRTFRSMFSPLMIVAGFSRIRLKATRMDRIVIGRVRLVCIGPSPWMGTTLEHFEILYPAFFA